nr:hypothetical protein [Klebsiella michiganensis]
MNDKVTLTVYKNSPHIWSGGLEGEDLAKWLIGKANAIRCQDSCQAKMIFHRESLRELQESSDLMKAYVSLGLSHKMTDPIPRLSEEAIQFDMNTGLIAATQPERKRDRVTPPLGYSLLPDLAEARAKHHLAKAGISAPGSIQCVDAKNA